MSTKSPWPYYGMLLKQIVELRAIVSFETDNAKTYGNRFAELIILMGVEIETLLRKATQCPKKRPNMNDYKDALKSKMPGVTRIKLQCTMYDWKRVRTPYPHLSRSKGYAWWDLYTGLKHDRYENEKTASLSGMFDVLTAYYGTAVIFSAHDPTMLESAMSAGGFLAPPEHPFANPNLSHVGDISFLTGEPKWHPVPTVLGTKG